MGERGGGGDRPKALVMKVNVGAILAEHWTQDPALGGGPAPIPLGEILEVSRVTIEVAASL